MAMWSSKKLRTFFPNASNTNHLRPPIISDRELTERAQYQLNLDPSSVPNNGKS